MRETAMPRVDLDEESRQLDELLQELLNDQPSPSSDSKHWINDGRGGILGQQSGSITTQSGNSRTIISWQTNQAGPSKAVTLTKQINGSGGTKWSDGELYQRKGEGHTDGVFQYQTTERRTETFKRQNAMSANSSESSSATLGKVTKTPPPPPVRKRLVSADELGMGLHGSSPGTSGQGEQGRKDLMRNCASDTEETRSWLDEQIWKLQKKKNGKSYQQHSKLEKQLIADLKTKLQSGGKYTQSDTDESFPTSPRQQAPPPLPRTDSQSPRIFGGSFDDMTISAVSRKYAQSDTDDSLLALEKTLERKEPDKITVTVSSKEVHTQPQPRPQTPMTISSREVPTHPQPQPPMTVSSREVHAQSQSQAQPQMTVSSREVQAQSQPPRPTVRKEPVRSLSLGDDPSKPTYKTKATYFVSGIERPAFSTHQTKYTFSICPVKSEETLSKSKPPPVPPPRSSAPTSPLIPKRGDSSREAVLRSSRKMVYSPTIDEAEQSLRLILEHSTTAEKEQRKVVASPVRDVEDELIVLKPIGPGIQTLEPDNAGTLKRPMTPLIPLSVTGTIDGRSSRGAASSRVVSPAPVSPQQVQVSPHQGQVNQQRQVNIQYSTETLQSTQQPPPVMNMTQPLGSGDLTMNSGQQQQWQQRQLWQQQQQWQQQQPPWQQHQQVLQQPLLFNEQLQPWQSQTTQQSWQQQTWPRQQSWPLQQPNVQMQQPFGTLSTSPYATMYSQSTVPPPVQIHTTEVLHQRIVEQKQQQSGFPVQSGYVGVQNNQAFDVQRGNSLGRQTQNQQFIVQDQRGQQFNTMQQLNSQQSNQWPNNQPMGSQLMGSQQLNAQPMGSQPMGSQQLNAQQMGGQTLSNTSLNSQHVGVQTMGTQQLSAHQMGAQMMGPQQMSAQQMVGQTAGAQKVETQQVNTQQQGVYQTGSQMAVQQGVQQSVQPVTVQQESAKYVTVEQNYSTLPQNGTLRQAHVSTVPAGAQYHEQQGSIISQNQRQQAQRQVYAVGQQSSAPDKDVMGRSMTLDSRTVSPVSIGGSWPSVGQNDTLRSQTLQVKKTGTTSQSMSYDTLMRATSPSSIYSGQFRNGSIGSLSDGIEYANTLPRFVRDTSKYWHKPNISREEAINLLKDKPPGSFVVRNSNTFQGGFGLALKVAQLPPNIQTKGDDMQANLVRHFLIESTSKGVRLKGCSNEPVFGSLAALVYQHTITPLALPCKLLLPSSDEFGLDETDKSNSEASLFIGPACNALYVDSVDTESLTGPEALSKAINTVFGTSKGVQPKTTAVQFKISYQGITLTDNKHRLFFRRHYPLNTVTFCGIDGRDRRWTLTSEDNTNVSGKLFGFIARKSGGSNDNACHLFLDPDNNQSADAIVNLVTKVMMGQGQFMKT